VKRILAVAAILLVYAVFSTADARSATRGGDAGDVRVGALALT
jgi:hypothetical protein